MARGLLPDHIGPLVDKLRSGNHPSVSLPDVAALTEILMRSLESYFKSVDLTIYQECQALADYIDDARQEIASLSPDHQDSAGIPRAGLELAAIVEQTESATNTIMESAERIMEADPDDTQAYQDVVNDAVMQIFEACSFQDITGQRISKVVNTLENVEQRVERLINILGVINDNQKPKTEEKATDEIADDKNLLNGPALDGEGIDQTEIDALLAGNPAEGNDQELEIDDLEENDAVAQDVETSAPPAETKNAPQPVAAPPAQEADSPANPESEVNQGDIDSLFDSPAADAEAENEPEKQSPAPEVKVEPNLIEKAKQQKAAALLKAKSKIPASKPVVYEEDATAGLQPKATEVTSQADIDALFS